MVALAATKILLVERRDDEYIAVFFGKVDPVDKVIVGGGFGRFILCWCTMHQHYYFWFRWHGHWNICVERSKYILNLCHLPQLVCGRWFGQQCRATTQQNDCQYQDY